MGRATVSTREPNVQRESVGIEQPEAPTKPRFAVASHELLFAEANERRCDACSTPLDAADEEHEGAGMYLWSRGGEIRREEVPLCPTCSSTIFASALGMFDFDDEE
ncbi:MAG TPA: hypothetical protein VGH87_13570 [Polyangiaceae bacterium]